MKNLKPISVDERLAVIDFYLDAYDDRDILGSLVLDAIKIRTRIDDDAHRKFGRRVIESVFPNKNDHLNEIHKLTLSVMNRLMSSLVEDVKDENWESHSKLFSSTKRKVRAS